MNIGFEHYICALFVFAIGSSFGSFFKLVVDRYGTGESFIFKPSYCLECKNCLQWWQNIPLISFLVLQGKCAFCKNKIDTNCFYAELTAALLLLALYLNAVNKGEGLLDSLVLLLFFLILILLSMFDLKHRVIPHAITYLSIVFILTFKFLEVKSIYAPLLDLGIAFIFMDLIYVFSTVIKKFELEINIICFPLLLWSVYFLFFQNIYFLIAIIIFYFVLVRFETLFSKFVAGTWLILVFLILMQILMWVFLKFNIEKLTLFFSGIGIIYLACEIIYYFFNLCFTSHKEVLNESKETKVTIGGGDITVFVLISVFLGYKSAFLTLFIASLLASISHFIFRAVGKYQKPTDQNSLQYIPLIPFVLTACFIIIMTTNG